MTTKVFDNSKQAKQALQVNELQPDEQFMLLEKAGLYRFGYINSIDIEIEEIDINKTGISDFLDRNNINLEEE